MIFRILSTLLLALALALPAQGPALAQDQAAPTAAPAADAGAIDYAVWEADATRAENLIAAGTASTAFLTNLRAALAGWRARCWNATPRRSIR
jgi:hypothetical protein